MASTHTAKTYIAAGTSNSASATTTGTVLDHSTAYGVLITTKITNGATGPTVAATVNVYTSHTNSTFAPKLFASAVAGTVANAVAEFAFVLPSSVMFSRVDVTGNTAQAVTCEAFCQELTTI